MRKHITTKSVSLNLKQNQISNLQSFLAHADKIHKEIYEQPIVANDILNMSKLLLIAQGDEPLEYNFNQATIITEAYVTPIQEGQKSKEGVDGDEPQIGNVNLLNESDAIVEPSVSNNSASCLIAKKYCNDPTYVPDSESEQEYKTPKKRRLTGIQKIFRCIFSLCNCFFFTDMDLGVIQRKT